MKSKYFMPALAATMALILPSCLDSDDNNTLATPTAIVTVCPAIDETFVMQLDDATQLIPVNMKKSPFGNKEVRALVNYTEVEEGSRAYTTRNVEVNWLDSIRTKLPVIITPSEDEEEDENDTLGDDPIEIVNDWVTVAEDGYLTLRFRTLWGLTNIPHHINLVTGINPDDPFEFELRHDAKGDTYGNPGDALIAFNLNHLSSEFKEVEHITLRWKSFSGDKTTTFDIKMRDKQPVPAPTSLVKAARID